MERLNCSAADAMAQLRAIADATSVSLAELAATLTVTAPDPTPAPAANGSIARLTSLDGVNRAIDPLETTDPGEASARSAALGADGDDVASLLGAELKSFGVTVVGLWLLRRGRRA